MEEWPMEQQSKKLKASTSDRQADSEFDLDALLHPARAFADPLEVVRDPDLTLNEKRAILASWASDACALEAAPELRVNNAGKVVRWDDIMDALRTLDCEADGYGRPLPHYKQVLAKKKAGLLGMRPRSRDSGDQGRVLN
jgi:hypothetical protein